MKFFLFLSLSLFLNFFIRSSLSPDEMLKKLEKPIEFCQKGLKNCVTAKMIKEKFGHRDYATKEQKEQIKPDVAPKVLELIKDLKNILTGTQATNTSIDAGSVFNEYRCVNILLYDCVFNNNIKLANQIIKNIYLFDEKIINEIKIDMQLTNDGEACWTDYATPMYPIASYVQHELKDEQNKHQRSAYIKTLIDNFLKNSKKKKNKKIKVQNTDTENTIVKNTLWFCGGFILPIFCWCMYKIATDDSSGAYFNSKGGAYFKKQ